MFNDIGALELVTVVILAVVVFGPDRLPKVIQDGAALIRKFRAVVEVSGSTRAPLVTHSGERNSDGYRD